MNNPIRFFTATILIAFRWKLADKPEDYYFSSAKYYIDNEEQWDFIPIPNIN